MLQFNLKSLAKIDATPIDTQFPFEKNPITGRTPNSIINVALQKDKIKP